MELCGWLIKECRVLSCLRSCCNDGHFTRSSQSCYDAGKEQSVDLVPLLAVDVDPAAEDGTVMMVAVVASFRLPVGAGVSALTLG